MPTRSKWSLIGIADHQGVLNVGGRVGAVGGPRAFRRAFSRLKGRDEVHESLFDGGDFHPRSAEVSKSHEEAAKKVRDAHRSADFSVVVGGGHDHGFSHLVGLSQALKGSKLGCINIDAHLDVREPTPLIGSGSPFYLALENRVIEPKSLVEFGIQAHSNAPELWKYAESKKVKIVKFEDLRNGKAIQIFLKCLRELSRATDAIVINLDLDAAAEAFAPGVSAPQAEGFSSTEILEMMETAGAEPKVVSLGIFELNPEHDVGGRTERLAATAAYHFAASALRR